MTSRLSLLQLLERGLQASTAGLGLKFGGKLPNE